MRRTSRRIHRNSRRRTSLRRNAGRGDALIRAAIDAAQEVYALGKRHEMAAQRGIRLPYQSEETKADAAQRRAHAAEDALRRFARVMGLDAELRGTATLRGIELQRDLYTALTTAAAAGAYTRWLNQGKSEDTQRELESLRRRLEVLGVNVSALDRSAATSLEGMPHRPFYPNSRRR